MVRVLVLFCLRGQSPSPKKKSSSQAKGVGHVGAKSHFLGGAFFFVSLDRPAVPSSSPGAQPL